MKITKYLALIGAITLVILGIVAYQKTSAFFSENSLNFRSPFQSPVQVVNKNEALLDNLLESAKLHPEPTTSHSWLIHRTTTENPSTGQNLSLEEYICSVFKSRCNDALKVAKAESGMRCDAMGVNTNKTFDAGLWQINSIHLKKGWKLADLLDCKKSTQLAFTIYEQQGFSPWVAAKKLGIK